ncbi:MAG: mannose-1-phosphate guanylyltransferase/mannose-6-phosphate isomerase [Gammaproteobacteria bacterium]
MSHLCPVILAGGGGTRLWPLSRELYPKQFLSFDQENSMLQLTLKRLDGLQGLKNGITVDMPLVLCNEEHRFLVAEHAELAGKPLGSIILEPEGRNTAPALTVAALSAGEEDPVVLMMPADHLITNVSAFHRAVSLGYGLALQGMLVTFGIRPTHPETGYGYINCGECLIQEAPSAFSIREFVEKPDEATARNYVESGDYFWNSGVFMMKTSVWLAAIERFQPGILSACQRACKGGARDGIFFRLEKESFLSCPSDSVDYAVMEKIGTDNTLNGALVDLDAGWSDIGSWTAVWDVSDKDSRQNVLQGDVIAKDTNRTIALSSQRLIATIGCDNMLIIETPDAVLVGDRRQSQDVKKIVAQLKDDNRVERVMHTRVYRPWGSYETLDNGEKFQVKRLTVKPGKKLSLQLHHHRAEHWVVVTGTATVTRGDETFRLNENESTYIPLGMKHRLENAEEMLLEVIEVQSGDYLGEDDIVRFEDDFGRLKNELS